MANQSGRAYALCALSPIKNGYLKSESHAEAVREKLLAWPLDESSPLARVPGTYLARLFVLDQVFFEGSPAKLDYLQSAYLVFAPYFHGDRDAYLKGVWDAIPAEVEDIWMHCVGFDGVGDAEGFRSYIAKCQLDTSLFFMGSTDDPVEEQLKSLYVKQEFSRFAAQHQGADAVSLQRAFADLIERVRLEDLTGPTWRPGQASL
jgi:hypothetical protein